MHIPDSYRAFYQTYLRFAIVMMFAGLLMGILFQESSKKTPYELLPPGPHLEAVFNLAMVHGHAFLLGVLMPLAVVGMMHLGLVLNARPIPERTLTWASRLYLPAATIAVMLLLYKGYHVQLGVRHQLQLGVTPGALDFAAIDQAYFFGSHAARAAIYGLSHTAMAVGLGWLMVSLWKSLKSIPASQPDPS